MNSEVRLRDRSGIKHLFGCVLWMSLATFGPAQSAAEARDLPKIPPDKASLNLLTSVQPDYPPLAKAARIQGIVKASITIDETGTVKIKSLISGHPMLAPAALEAIQKWKYKPFLVDGKLTAVQTDVQVSIPEGLTQAAIDQERKFHEAYWENHREGRAALEKGDLTTAEAKFLLARKAAEERGEEKWRELAGVLSFLGTVKREQNDFDAAEQLYKQSLDMRLKHQRLDESGVAGAQEDLATLYYVNQQFDKAEPLLSQSIKSYETQLQGTSASQDQATIGRNIALEYLALSQIATAGGRRQESQDHCKQARDYAEKWAQPSDKDMIAARCADPSGAK